ncbi:hypothetical protein E2C01_046187 [Portunus trituberculatus]|uniref:Uncharacterized protein n=1 Tax=Portunus trituberculatus TaxID=210409 RepID=A0A5B7G0A0_PORTR|nr:hypothetical protein [Portunus trituberculatus]
MGTRLPAATHVTAATTTIQRRAGTGILARGEGRRCLIRLARTLPVTSPEHLYADTVHCVGRPAGGGGTEKTDTRSLTTINSPPLWNGARDGRRTDLETDRLTGN